MARAGLAAATIAALAAASTQSRASATPPTATSLGACLLRPTADLMPFDVSLIGTFRTHNGVIEVLHNVACTGGHTDTIWISTNNLTPAG